MGQCDQTGIDEGTAVRQPEAQRDWGFAGDYVQAMWAMLQQEQPENFVIGTGETHSVREFCEIAFGQVGLDYREFVVQDPHFYRPAEVDVLISDPSKAKRVLEWKPEADVKQLVENDGKLGYGALENLLKIAINIPYSQPHSMEILKKVNKFTPITITLPATLEIPNFQRTLGL